MRDSRSGACLGRRIALATSLFARARGLLGRAALAPGEGLWLEPCSSIHMFFMRFAIDVVFVDRERRVVRVSHEVRPWRIALGGARARAALELPAGAARASDVRVGDLLEIDGGG